MAIPFKNGQIGNNMAKPDFMNYYDTFKNSRPSRDYKACLEYDEKIGV